MSRNTKRPVFCQLEDNIQSSTVRRRRLRDGIAAGNLDTLAQLPTGQKKAAEPLPFESLAKRAKSKWYTNQVVVPLLTLDSKLHKQYQRAFYCNDTLLQNGNTVTGKYCNSRVCHICNRIRTAKFLNGYGEPLKALGSLQFVTLTVPNCPAEALLQTISLMTSNATNIMRVLREKRKIKCSGIRKIEVTYNHEEDTFHPHFHIIVDKGVGDMIVQDWLNRYPLATYKAQDCRPADVDSFNELFKYSTKIVQGEDGKAALYPIALDIIMQALDRRRTFQTFGTIKKVSEDVEDIDAVEIPGIEPERAEWLWSKDVGNWVNVDEWGEYRELIPDYKRPNFGITIYV